jgi:hypothetical protein
MRAVVLVLLKDIHNVPHATGHVHAGRLMMSNKTGPPISVIGCGEEGRGKRYGAGGGAEAASTGTYC